MFEYLKKMGQGLSAFQQFPYQVGTPINSYQGKSIWTLCNGTKKEDGSPVSIFTFDIKKNPGKLDVAKNGFKRSKTIRHPNFLTYLDGLETDTNIYIVTEPVTPLDESIEDIRKYENAISWGVYQITKALSFINNDVNLTHGNVNTATVFVTKSGDWKLGGLDLVGDIRDANPFLKQHGDQVPVKYKPPEVTKGQWSQINTAPSYGVDSWMLGCLIYECYNGPMSKSDDVRDLAQIPKPVHQSYQKCFSAKIENRLNPSKFLECPYFQNIFVETCVFLENITLKDNFEKETFFKKLDQHIDKLPMNICKFKILPHLITAFDFGPVNPKILGTLLKISANLSTEEYVSRVVPSVVKWFQSDDRVLRVNLLENLEHYIQHLSPSVINDQIFPNVINGFNDKPVLKEITIKSMLLFAPKLSEKTMIQLLKYFAALQNDPEPGIRTNTTICLGRIAEHISDSTRKRVLIPAFSTALKDPFPPSQNAGLNAFMFTQQYYSAEEIATRVIPEISKILIRPDKSTRTIAFQAINIFLKKVETLMANVDSGDSSQPNAAAAGQQQQSQDGVLGLTGWAYEITKKYMSAENSPSTGSIQSQQINQQQQTHQQTVKQQQNNSFNSNQSKSSTSSNYSSSNNKPQPKVQQSEGWGDEEIEDYDEEEEEEEEEEVKYKPPTHSSKSSYSSSSTNQSVQKSSNTSTPSYSSPSISSSDQKAKGMQLGPKQKQSVTNKLSKFSFEDEDNNEDSNSNSNWGDHVTSPPSTSASNNKSSNTSSSGWGDGWDDGDVTASDNKTTPSTTSSTKSLKKTNITTSKVTSKVASNEGWEDW